MLTTLRDFLMQPVGGIPLWGPALAALIIVTNAAVRAAKWTNAQDDIQLLCRLLLKSPTFGPILASIPILGDILHHIADDAENLPPTLKMRVQGKVPPKAPPPPSANTVILLCALGFFACATLKAAAIDFASCELGKLPGSVTSIVPDVEKALEGQDVTWQSDLETIGKKAGFDAVNCAVASILHNVSQVHGELSARAKTKVVRGRIWLAQHGHSESSL